MLVVACLLALSVGAAGTDYTLPNGLGNGLYNPFTTTPLFEATRALPSSLTDAANNGWFAQNNGACLPNLGILYSQAATGPAPDASLSIYFTPAGQVAGVKSTIYGSGNSWFSGHVGPAAPAKLVSKGFWEVEGSEAWSISLSFRGPSDVCSSTSSPLALGDRLVINQHTIAHSMPLTTDEATQEQFQPGSCMATMGQHWFHDVEGGASMTWEYENLLPIVPMYYVDGPNKGNIHAFFVTTPVSQPGSDKRGADNWDAIPLPAKLMCDNFCNDDCTWNTHFWSTQHIYLDSNYKTLKCPGASWTSPVGRTCPSGTLGGHHDVLVTGSSSITPSTEKSGPRDIVIVGVSVVVGVCVVAVVIALVVVARTRRAHRSDTELENAALQTPSDV